MERWWRCVWYFKINQIFPFLVIKPPFLCFFSLLTQGHRLNLFGTLHRSLHLSNSARCCFHSDATIDTCHPSHTRSKLDHNYHFVLWSLLAAPHPASSQKDIFLLCHIQCRWHSLTTTKTCPQIRFIFTEKEKNCWQFHSLTHIHTQCTKCHLLSETVHKSTRRFICFPHPPSPKMVTWRNSYWRTWLIQI